MVTLLVGYLAVSQDFKIDPGHTLIEFNVERFMVGEVTGKFKKHEGLVSLGQNGVLQSASITIETNSLDTDHEVRDGHLKSPVWLDAANHPSIEFKSTAIRNSGDQLVVEGELTIRGQTNRVSFPFEMKGPFKDPTGMNTIGLTGDLVIDRQDYGIRFSKMMDNGELFIGNEVRIRIRALAVEE